MKAVWSYLLVSIACALFGAVYEHFSHGVYSPFMIYAFAFPLVGGTLPFLGMASRGFSKPAFSWCFYHAGIASWTVGSFVQGVLDIYGTDSSLLPVYWYAGGIMFLLKLAMWLLVEKTASKNE